MELRKKANAGRVAAASIAIAALAGSLHGQATEQWSFSPAAGTTSQRFGYAMDVKGSLMVCGAPYEDTKATDAGAASVYRLDTVTNTWKFEQQLFASDFEASARFGTAVAIDGNICVVGAPYKDTTKGIDGGQFYVFRYDATAKVWNQEQKLLPSVGGVSDYFGISVDVSGDAAIVGASRSDTVKGSDSGAAFVFRYKNTFVKWVEEQQLIDPDGAGSDYAGESVSLDGTTAVVTSSSSLEGANYGAGSVGVWTSSGTTWTQSQEIVSPNPAYYAYFGAKARIKGDLLGICAPNEDFSASVPDSGNAYLFRRVGGTFVFEKKFSPPTPVYYTYYGNDIDFTDDLVIVGFQNDTVSGKGSAGSAHLYRTDKKGNWIYDHQLGASDALSSDRFGAQVALTPGSIIVSADGNDTVPGYDWGVIYGFDDSEITLTITPSHPAPGQSMTFSAFRGDPGAVVMVTISDVAGVPTFIPLVVYVFAADHTFTFPADAPNPLYGVQVGMRAWKISPTGPVVVSDVATIDV